MIRVEGGRKSVAADRAWIGLAHMIPRARDEFDWHGLSVYFNRPKFQTYDFIKLYLSSELGRVSL